MEPMARKLQIIVLAHLWALAPLALVWFVVPTWRGQPSPTDATVGALGHLAPLALGYVIVRTVCTLRSWMPRLDPLALAVASGSTASCSA